MELFISIIRWIFLITGWLALGYSAYFIILSFFSLAPVKRKYSIVADKNKFCIFIPCHNEEDVIAASVANIAGIEYDPTLVDFYVIADNCSDNTAANARDKIAELGLSNFHVLERNVNDPKKRGKPHALRWGIELLESEDKFYNYYDMFMILDADNFADANILKEINSQYESEVPSKRPCMIQCYLDSKNADNTIAKGYSYGYRIFCNRAHQLSKSRIGLNATIGGTGFAITMDFLRSDAIDGFRKVTSLTEDLEIQTIANRKGLRIYYNPHAHVYDEKPTGLKQSFVQKTRWSQGHWYVCFKYGIFLLGSVFKARSPRAFFSKIDNFIYLHAFMFLLSWFINFVCVGISLVSGYGMPMLIDFGFGTPLFWGAVAVFLYSTVIYPYIIIKQDGTQREKHWALPKMPYVYLCLFLSSLVYTFSTMKGLLFCSRQGKWAKTKHIQTKNSNIDTVKEPETAGNASKK